jgi:hypothetical protein
MYILFSFWFVVLTCTKLTPTLKLSIVGVDLGYLLDNVVFKFTKKTYKQINNSAIPEKETSLNTFLANDNLPLH